MADSPPYSLAPPVEEPRRPLIRHLLLLLATLVTVSFAGGSEWARRPDAAWSGGSPGVLDTLGAGLGYGLLVLAILGAHEMGHFLACRYWRVSATLPFFVPGIPPLGTFGALIRVRDRIPHRRALFDIAVAGPIAGFAVALPIAIGGLVLGDKMPPDVFVGGRYGRPLLFHLIDHAVFGETLLQHLNAMFGAAWVGMLVTSLNLFPVGQLDGGHTVYAISRRLHRVVSWTTIVALAVWIVVSLARGQLPPYLLWLVFLLWMRHRHPPLLDEDSSIGGTRRVVAIVVGIIFLLSFIPTPLIL